MRKSYLDYSMSVIIGRALPDVRDGLKPVHRRILYAMHTEGLHHSKRYSKCAGIVGGEIIESKPPARVSNIDGGFIDGLGFGGSGGGSVDGMRDGTAAW